MVGVTPRAEELGFAGSPVEDIRSSYTRKRKRMLGVDPEMYNKNLFFYQDGDYESSLNTLELFRPHLFYTFIPEQVAFSGPEYSYHFVDQKTISYSCAGSVAIEHGLWDWTSSEYIKYNCPNGEVLVYQKELRCVSPDRFLVFLTPYSRSYESNTAKTLTRFSLNDSAAPALRQTRAGGTEVSVGAYGQPASVTLTETDLATIRLRTQTLKSAISLESLMLMTKVTRQQAAVLLAYLTFSTCEPKYHVVPSMHAVKSYQWNDYIDGVVKTPMIAFCSPLIDAGYVAARTPGNDKKTIDERVRSLQEHAEDPVDPKYHKYLEEFIGHTASPLVALDYEAVMERQDNARKVRNLLQADEGYMSRVVKCFQKAEAYIFPNDPRNISTDPPREKYEASTFAYPVMSSFKRFDWYAFGRTPVEIAHKVAQLCATNGSVTETDYSRWDGRLSKFMKLGFAQYLITCFGRSKALDRVVADRNNRRGVTAFGEKFDTGFSQMSGDMFTSASNSWLNAFICYCAAREEGRSSNVAYKNLGIFGGDDGLTPVGKASLEKVATAFHIVLKARVCTADNGEWPTFLSRQFGPAVWKGDPSSCCDLVRQLSKFHLTTNCDPNIDVVQKMKEKAFSYWLTDSQTPLMGPLCTTLLKAVEHDGQSINNDHTTFWSQYDKTVQFPNEVEEWAPDYLERCGLSESVGTLNAWIAKMAVPHGAGVFSFHPELLRLPLLIDTVEQPPKNGVVVVNGENHVSLKLGQLKMKQVLWNALKFAHEHKMSHIIYVGAWGPLTSEWFARKAKSMKISVDMYDPLFRTTGKEFHDMIKAVQDPYTGKRPPGWITVFNRAFALSDAKSIYSKAGPGRKTMFLDDSLILDSKLDSGPQRLQHFNTVISWVMTLQVQVAFLKTPMVAYDKMTSLAPYTVKSYRATAIDGHPVTERRLFMRRVPVDKHQTKEFKIASVLFPNQYGSAAELSHPEAEDMDVVPAFPSKSKGVVTLTLPPSPPRDGITAPQVNASWEPPASTPIVHDGITPIVKITWERPPPQRLPPGVAPPRPPRPETTFTQTPHPLAASHPSFAPTAMYNPKAGEEDATKLLNTVLQDLLKIPHVPEKTAAVKKSRALTKIAPPRVRVRGSARLALKSKPPGPHVMEKTPVPLRPIIKGGYHNPFADLASGSAGRPPHLAPPLKNRPTTPPTDDELTTVIVDEDEVQFAEAIVMLATPPARKQRKVPVPQQSYHLGSALRHKIRDAAEIEMVVLNEDDQDVTPPPAPHAAE
jgi:hypothetical protein